MFGRDHDDDPFDDDFFKNPHKHFEESERSFNTMSSLVSIFIYVVTGLVVFGILVACCCRKKRYNGRVLSPPPPPPPGPNVTSAVVVQSAAAPAPYPQQQYAPYPTHAHHQVTPYPQSGAPYPGAVNAYPAVSPYPAAGAPYPTAGAPYPAAGAPYPASGAPYPAAVPSAPDANAMPPPYEQAILGDKQPPYNPQAH